MNQVHEQRLNGTSRYIAYLELVIYDKKTIDNLNLADHNCISELSHHCSGNHDIVCFAGGETNARPLANASKNLTGRVQNRPWEVAFCIEYIRDCPVRPSAKNFSFPVCFVSLNSHLYSALVTAVLYEISCYIGPHCNSSQLYFQSIGAFTDVFYKYSCVSG